MRTGIKVSSTGYVTGVIPGGSGSVTVKSGKVSSTISVQVKEGTDRIFRLNKTFSSVVIPHTGNNAKIIKLKPVVPNKAADWPKITWSVLGNPKGVIVKSGIISVDSSAMPGSYIIKATPVEDSGYNSAYCEILVK